MNVSSCVNERLDNTLFYFSMCFIHTYIVYIVTFYSGSVNGLSKDHLSNDFAQSPSAPPAAKHFRYVQIVLNY